MTVATANGPDLRSANVDQIDPAKTTLGILVKGIMKAERSEKLCGQVAKGSFLGSSALIIGLLGVTFACAGGASRPCGCRSISGSR